MVLGNVDLNLLVVMQALLEEENLTRAGVRVGMPQPAMSTALARLRRHFKDELLMRTGNGYALTPLARSLLPSVQDSVLQIGRAFSPENTLSPPDGRTISISISDYSVVVLGKSLLQRMHELAPGVNLEMRPAMWDMAGSDRDAFQQDLLIAPVGFWSGGQPEIICRDRYVLVVDAANPRLRDGRLSLADLASMPHAVVQSTNARVDPVGAALERFGITPQIAMTTAGCLPLPFVVAGTDMVAAVPERLARKLSQAAGVTVAEGPFGMIEMTEAAWWHPGRAADPAVAWLRSVLSDLSMSLSRPVSAVEPHHDRSSLVVAPPLAREHSAR